MAEAPLPVSVAIMRALIKHQTYLLRYSNSLTADVVGLLNEQVYPDVAAALEARLAAITARGYDLGPVVTATLKALESQLQTIIAAGYGNAQTDFTEATQDLATQEGKYNLGALNSALPDNVSFNTVLPAPATLSALAVDAPFLGYPLGEWFDELGTKTADNVLQALRVGIAEGQTTDDIVRRLVGTKKNNFTDGLFDGARRDAQRLVRTAVSHVSSMARDATYQANADVVQSVQWVATLDDRTCEICGDLDGQTFPVGSGPRPPGPHPECRCTTVPVVSSYKQLGIPADELDAGTRASMNGQVPETMTYDDWLKTQSEATQDDILGPTRGAIYRAGDLNVGNFVADGRLMTLEELAKAEPEAHAAAVKSKSIQ
jgi:SPP1 gp7 family putative phage head morphogenesis protein